MSTPRLPPEKIRLPRWTPARDLELCELVSTGCSFTEIGHALGVSKGSALGRFSRIAARMEGKIQP